jgi:hypothetical protein
LQSHFPIFSPKSVNGLVGDTSDKIGFQTTGELKFANILGETDKYIVKDVLGDGGIAH